MTSLIHENILMTDLMSVVGMSVETTLEDIWSLILRGHCMTLQLPVDLASENCCSSRSLDRGDLSKKKNDYRLCHCRLYVPSLSSLHPTSKNEIAVRSCVIPPASEQTSGHIVSRIEQEQGPRRPLFGPRPGHVPCPLVRAPVSGAAAH